MNKLILVIDADITRAAGISKKDKPWHKDAKNAFHLLNKIREDEKFSVVFNQQLLKEWKKHQSYEAIYV